MTTIISIFMLSLAVSLVLTPQIRNIAIRYKIVDLPSARKVHSEPIPRIGGVAIYLAFFLPFVSVLFYSTQILDLLTLDKQIIHLILGSSMVFGLGVIDDVRRLGPKLKFAVQIVAALVAYEGGIKITVIFMPLIILPDKNP
jgi:UDP-GlcNAc:undecaprenyl-phosphate/decaprenyl-phosphate GlcNAc-1-phosphate transferase